MSRSIELHCRVELTTEHVDTLHLLGNIQYGYGVFVQRGYLAEDGTWIVQRGGAVAAADAPGTVVPPTMIEGSGVTLRAFHVPVAAEQGPPK